MVQLQKMEETIGVHAHGPLMQGVRSSDGGKSGGGSFPVVPVLAATALVFLGLLGWLGAQIVTNGPRKAPVETASADSAAASPLMSAPAAPAAALQASDPAEQALWEDTLRRNEMSAFQAFLKRYPQSVFAPEAAWLSTPDTVAGYTTFLQNYPTSPHVEEARTRREMRATQDARADDAAWQTALDIDQPAAYRQYLNAFPNGLHAAEAQRDERHLRSS